MGEVGDTPLAGLEGRNDDHENDNANQVLGFDHEGEGKKKNFTVPVKHAEGNQ